MVCRPSIKRDLGGETSEDSAWRIGRGTLQSVVRLSGGLRNPLADPYLLGAAAGAGLGATVAIVTGSGDGIGAFDLVPVLAFLGAMGAVIMTYFLGYSSGARRSPSALLLAGVAVAAFLTAIQTFIQQQNVESIRQVYSWILGRLNTSSWTEVKLLAPYALLAILVLLSRRALDVMRLVNTEHLGGQTPNCPFLGYSRCFSRHGGIVS